MLFQQFIPVLKKKEKFLGFKVFFFLRFQGSGRTKISGRGRRGRRKERATPLPWTRRSSRLFQTKISRTAWNFVSVTHPKRQFFFGLWGVLLLLSRPRTTFDARLGFWHPCPSLQRSVVHPCVHVAEVFSIQVLERRDLSTDLSHPWMCVGSENNMGLERVCPTCKIVVTFGTRKANFDCWKLDLVPGRRIWSMIDTCRWHVSQSRFFAHQHPGNLLLNAELCAMKSVVVFCVYWWRTFLTDCEVNGHTTIFPS